MPELPYSLENRFLSLTTPLGEDVLLPNTFTISERLSAPYRIDLDLLADRKVRVSPSKLLGEPVTLALAYGDLQGSRRYFHGIVSEMSQGAEDERFRRYRITVVPKLWLLTLSHHFRSFENMTVPDVVRQVLSPYGMQTRWSLTGDYSQWNFCFQYRETDFNFISRLLEEEGIFYFFEFSNGNHTLVFADSPSAFKPCPDQSSAAYEPELGPEGADAVSEWESEQELRTGGLEVWDWHFEKAPTPYSYSAQTPQALAGTNSYKLREFPSRAAQPFNEVDSVSGVSGRLEQLSDMRMQGIESVNPVFRGTTTCRAFSCGQRFTLRGGHAPGEYVLTRIEHTGSQYPPYLFGMESSILYTNSVECFEHGKNYRPPRTAERSLVPGPQTALVTEGPDKYGRMRVTFHWGPGVTSAWVRVAQRWAGTQWGTIFLPRVGHEVIVDFIDGDPDHPIIVGSVYNAQNMPPYTLPDKYTQSGIKTRSMSPDGSSQGGADEFNELRFDDKTGSEEIYFHAQKDFNRLVEHDDDLKVENDQTITITNNRTEIVKQGNEKITIEQGNRSVYVNTGDDTHQVKTGNRDAIIDMGNDTLTVKMGNHTRKINLGKSETEAMQSITLKVGANKIVVDQTGITLDGIMIKFKGQAMIDSQAPMQKMNGDAMVMIKGGLTMIN
jgi:type VI secretion system secreted protein VgrG